MLNTFPRRANQVSVQPPLSQMRIGAVAWSVREGDTLTRTSISAKRKELPVTAPLAVIIVVASCVSGSFTAIGQGVNRQPGNGRPPAVPLEAKTAILEAFRQYRVVAIGDAHGNRLGSAFHLALIRDPRFPSTVNDILIESGNARYQADLDRYVRGEDVPRERLQQIWLDTTQQHVASLDLPEIVTAVRTINAALGPERRLRILLGEPPIEWERMKTPDDFRAWNESPASDRDPFAANLIR